MTTYQKILNVYAMLRNWIREKMSKYDVASEFKENKAYAVGRLVIHDDKLYRCVQYFSGGTWPNPNPYFVESTIDEALQDVHPNTSGNLYVKDEDGKLHKVVIEKSGELYTLAVDQEALREEDAT